MSDPVGAWIEWMEGTDNVTVFFASFLGVVFGAVAVLVGLIALGVWIGESL